MDGYADDPGERKAFGARLKAAREHKKLTQQQVADRFSVLKQTVSAWENGRGDPGVFTLRRLVALYGVNADALLGVQPMSPAAIVAAQRYDALPPQLREKWDTLWLGFAAGHTSAEQTLRIDPESVTAQEDAKAHPVYPESSTGPARPADVDSLPKLVPRGRGSAPTQTGRGPRRKGGRGT